MHDFKTLSLGSFPNSVTTAEAADLALMAVVSEPDLDRVSARGHAATRHGRDAVPQIIVDVGRTQFVLGAEAAKLLCRDLCEAAERLQKPHLLLGAVLVAGAGCEAENHAGLINQAR